MRSFALRPGGNRGFTLVELLVVIVILTILATAFIVGTRVLRRPGEVRQRVAAVKLAQIETILAEFKMDMGRFPGQEEGLMALVEAPAELEEKWTESYCKEKDLLDPWGREFVYEFPGTRNRDSYDLYSLGGDGAPGGEGENADVVNW